MDRARVQVDVIPDQPEQLGDPHPGEQRRRDQRPISGGAAGKQPGDLVAPEHALDVQLGPRTLTALIDGDERSPAGRTAM